MRHLLVWWGITLGAVACSDPDQPSDGSNDAGSGGTHAGGGTGGTSGASGSGAQGGIGGSGGSSGSAGMQPACNTLPLDAPDYVIAFVAGSPPAAKGGTVANGTYFYNRLIMYGSAGPDVVAGRGKVVLTGSDWESIEDLDATSDDDINPSLSSSATLGISGVEFTLTATCPDADELSGSYTAEGDTLTLYVLDHGAMFGEEFKLQ
jgi:hypothetical protein